MISLIIPTNKTNSEYTSNIVKNIREIYPDETQVEIIVSEDDTQTIGRYEPELNSISVQIVPW